MLYWNLWFCLSFWFVSGLRSFERRWWIDLFFWCVLLCDERECAFWSSFDLYRLFRLLFYVSSLIMSTTSKLHHDKPPQPHCSSVFPSWVVCLCSYSSNLIVPSSPFSSSNLKWIRDLTGSTFTLLKIDLFSRRMGSASNGQFYSFPSSSSSSSQIETRANDWSRGERM